MGFNRNLLQTLYVFTVPMKAKSAESVVQAYLSGILVQTIEQQYQQIAVT